MALTPRFRQLSLEDYPDAPAWLAPLFQTLNETMGGLVDALNNGLTRSENLASKTRVGIGFTVPATGPALVTFGNDLGSVPQHVWISKLARKDGAAIASAFSLTWAVTDQGSIQCTLLGLVASTEYVLSVVYE